MLDLGSGSGLVAIAAAMAGAREATGADIDPFALEALSLNAAANGVKVAGLLVDPEAAEPIAADLVVAGDLFYERDLADRTIRRLDRCRAAGADVLIGDPWRACLPVSGLRLLAGYAVPDFGDGRGGALTQGGVFTIERSDQQGKLADFA